MTVLDYFCSIGNGCVEYDLANDPTKDDFVEASERGRIFLGFGRGRVEMRCQELGHLEELNLASFGRFFRNRRIHDVLRLNCFVILGGIWFDDLSVGPSHHLSTPRSKNETLGLLYI